VQSPDRFWPKADLLLIDKSERTLRLFAGDLELGRYPISLGFDPVGDKSREGDGRTPEGRYRLDWRNEHSAFYLALHISYPDVRDLAESAGRGVAPGGDIFIHGSPNWWPIDSMFPAGDWTRGCIALSNEDMRELWLWVRNGAEVLIRP
jgi:murein L,D-transpeptidase YafK